MSHPEVSVDQPITVMLADDHPLLREALRSVLERQHDITVVGEAANGDVAVRMAMELRPRVAIVDISMPGLSGFEAAQAIRTCCPETAILVLSVHDDSEHIRRMLEIGVAGYLTKDVLGDQVVQAVRAVDSGGVALSPSVLNRVVRGGTTGAVISPTGGSSLTERELGILKLTARGLTNTQIAAECGLSPRTVRGYLETIFAKLHVTNRTEAVAEALRLGLISVSDLRRGRQDAPAG